MRLCVVGLGRLGLPWGLLADAAGHEVRGLDVDAKRVAAINRRLLDTREPGVGALLEDPRCGLTATTDPAEALARAELSVVTVPTPSRADGSFGLAAVLAAVREIGAHARELDARHVVVLKSTVSPGATDGAVRAALTASARRASAGAPADAADGSDGAAGTSLGLVHAPEFHAIGSIVRDITHPYQVILGGSEEWALSRAHELYASLIEEDVPIVRLDAAGAELAKLASNSFRTMKIAFANTLAELSTAHGSDPRAVCAAVAADPHIGRGYLAPGLPYGGPCYPRDNPALRAAASAAGVVAPLPAAIEAANERRFDVLERAALEAAPGPIGIVGIAFKAGTGELEGSPALELAERWRRAGREVLVHDPLARTPAGTSVPLGTLLDSCAVVLLAAADARLTAQLQVELDSRERRPRILDPWGALTPTPPATAAARPPRASPRGAG
jgi:UDPglucose 6-dehydrogenase